jgi:uncharacterized membrane protein YbhN (UPF0104 family)
MSNDMEPARMLSTAALAVVRRIKQSVTDVTTRNRTILLIAKAAVAVGLLAWLFAGGHIDLRPLASTEHAWLHLAAMVVLFGGVVLQALRWSLLLGIQGVHLPLADALRITLVGYFGSLFMPGHVGAEVVRAYYISKHAPDRKLAASMTVLLDRVLGLYAFLLMSLVSLVCLAIAGGSSSPVATRLLPFVAAPFLALTVLFGAPWHPRVRALAVRITPNRFREAFRASLDAYAAEPRRFLLALALSVAGMLPAVVAYLFASWIAGDQASWLTVAAVAPVVVIIGVLPISPQGLGVAEASAALLFGQFGVASGATIVLVNRLWALGLCLPGAMLYVTSRTPRPTATDGA